MFGTDDLPGLAPGLTVADEAGWTPATELVDGTRLPQLLDAARHRWNAAPHAAAALAWKAYTYWLALPAVLGWASARRVPLLRPADVLIHFEDDQPLLTLGLRRCTEVAVLPTDPLALAGRPEVRVVADEAALLAALRESLLDQHLTPMLDSIHDRVRLGSRTLLGSVASGVAHGVLRAADTLPGSSAQHIGALLDALDIGDLIELVPGPTGELTVQRRTCCLAFTLPQPKICAGCCIRPS
ncbi:IucA/IucC family C-terminal-domain containing protein [Solwaraspora sp. WMMD1047]|uniref:IucA/IucC family C-terminal-domain containing protein n=1 Tax=Solwaraspora sp. WMMD1047 TaxID=3016102 RepID=UPI002418036C|nr:IucA/IucC family C-terminal-domain containing protein [Solwaraspora sp. WMMD1047]MDG4834073.1 IucA/IucC family C-terminal-domain containing protein [Solwaraspora sp. WMMD1047]